LPTLPSIGCATVLPGDLVLAKTGGVVFIAAILAEQAIVSAEFTNLEDAVNFELKSSGKERRRVRRRLVAGQAFNRAGRTAPISINQNGIPIIRAALAGLSCSNCISTEDHSIRRSENCLHYCRWIDGRIGGIVAFISHR
jgi:hypothetical protein